MSRAHNATWKYHPVKGGSTGQYYCPDCGLNLKISWNQNNTGPGNSEVSSITGWIWRIEDLGGNDRSDEAGNKYIAKYVNDVSKQHEVEEEGLKRYHQFPCLPRK